MGGFHAAPPTVQHFSIVLRQGQKKNSRRTNMMWRAAVPSGDPGGPAASGVESPEPRAPGALPPSAPSNAGPGGPAGLSQAADVFLC